jgi:hypothetical protein
MKNYLSVLLGFSLVIMGVWLGALFLFKQHGADQLEIDRTVRERQILQGDRAGYEAEVALSAEYKPLIDAFVAQWEEPIAFTRKSDDFSREIQNRLTRMTQANFISPTKRNLEEVKNYEFQGEERRAHVLSWTVTGPYQRVMTWLGQIESEFPLIRTQSVKISPLDSADTNPGQNNILKMSVRMVYPNFSDEVPSK